MGLDEYVTDLRNVAVVCLAGERAAAAAKVEYEEVRNKILKESKTTLCWFSFNKLFGSLPSSIHNACHCVCEWMNLRLCVRLCLAVHWASRRVRIFFFSLIHITHTSHRVQRSSWTWSSLMKHCCSDFEMIIRHQLFFDISRRRTEVKACARPKLVSKVLY